LTSPEIERGDLPSGQASLPRERRQIRDPVGPRSRERRCGPLSSGFEGLNLADAGGKLEGEALQLCASIPGVSRRLSALPGAPLELVELRDGVVEGCGAEEDGDPIRLPLLVKSPQAVAEETLGRLEGARDDIDLLLDPLSLQPEALVPVPEAGQLVSSPREPRIEGIEAQQNRLGTGSKPCLPLAQRARPFLRACAISPRKTDTEDERGSERQPEREAALPTPTHRR
jgi:hypothetical protein